MTVGELVALLESHFPFLGNGFFSNLAQCSRESNQKILLRCVLWPYPNLGFLSYIPYVFELTEQCHFPRGTGVLAALQWPVGLHFLCLHGGHCTDADDEGHFGHGCL